MGNGYKATIILKVGDKDYHKITQVIKYAEGLGIEVDYKGLVL